MEALALFPDLGGHWYAISSADPVACCALSAALLRRKATPAPNKPLNFMGPGETIVLVTTTADAVFAWQRTSVRHGRWARGIAARCSERGRHPVQHPDS